MKTVARIESIFLMMTFIMSCQDFVQIDPPRTDLTRETVFSDDATAEAAMSGIYQQMVSPSSFSDGGNLSISFLTSLSSDENRYYFFASPEVYGQFNNNELNQKNIFIDRLWSQSYEVIYQANSIIEALEKSSAITENTKLRLEGEAKFIRAFCHFYLVNLFGDVPLVLTTDYPSNISIARTPKDEVYNQIISDLIRAKEVLPNDYAFANGERVRANTWAATALLARVYLYVSDWEHAEAEATSIINNIAEYELTDLSGVFLRNSKEAIFQLGKTTDIAADVVTFDYPTFRRSAFTPSLVSSFEDNDQRKVVWVSSVTEDTSTFYSSSKYKGLDLPPTEYTMVLRLAEQYLIRAEVRARQNNLTGSNSAASDINVIRSRAGLLNTASISQTDLLSDVMQERRVELFNEWGHRWMDLQRTGQVNDVMLVEKSNWQSFDELYPIPEKQINNSPSMKNAQNFGY